MKFNDVTPYKIVSETIDFEAISAKASESAFRDEEIPTPFLIGCESPIEVEGTMALVVEEFALLSVVIQERKVTGNEVKTALKPRVKEFESRMGHSPSKPELTQLKEEVKHDLMRVTPPVAQSYAVIIDRANSTLYFSTRSKAKLDALSKYVSEKLSIKLVAAFHEADLMKQLTSMLAASESMDELFSLGDRAALLDPVNSSTVSIRDDDLMSDEIQALLAADKKVKALQLRIQDQATFVLHADWRIASLKIEDSVFQEVESDDESLVAQLQGSLLIYGRLLRRIFATLLKNQPVSTS